MTRYFYRSPWGLFEVGVDYYFWQFVRMNDQEFFKIFEKEDE